MALVKYTNYSVENQIIDVQGKPRTTLATVLSILNKSLCPPPILI